MTRLDKGPSRALARHHDARVKARVFRTVRDTWHRPEALLTPKGIGRLAAVHMRPCSCAGCQRESRRPWPRELR